MFRKSVAPAQRYVPMDRRGIADSDAACSYFLDGDGDCKLPSVRGATGFGPHIRRNLELGGFSG